MKKNNMLNIIGLMSGTSMDGINGSFVRTDGINLKRYNISEITSYSSKSYFLLNKAQEKPDNYMYDISFRNELNYHITYDHYKNASILIEKAKLFPELIGFHGQTLIHKPEKGISLQIGDAKLLAKLLKTPVVSQFRQKDLELGGQGAPVSPIYHLSIIKEKNLILPCCFLNLGGIANITYWDGKTLIGFDTGPANVLMDTYMQRVFNKKYDKNGCFASKGKTNLKILHEILKDNYFKITPPKSLDKFNFNYVFKKLYSANINEFDVMATLAEFTFLSIKKSFSLLPQNIKTLVLMGGGVHNLYLLKKIKNLRKIKTLTAQEINIPGDFVEAEMIAYLAGRSNFNLPITFPSTTGVKAETTGGIIDYP